MVFMTPTEMTALMRFTVTRYNIEETVTQNLSEWQVLCNCVFILS